MMQFNKAVKRKARLRIGLVGPSGTGKTYTALRIAKGLGGRVAVIDTEHGSASLYADQFDFDVLELETFSPDTYVEAIEAAAAAGYSVVIVDSLSHAWMGKDGALEQVDKHSAREKGNSFAAWRHVTPKHNRLIDALIGAPVHLIATMRAKTEYVIEENERGKKTPRKIGMAPVQREGMEYEFTVVGDLDHDHRLVVTKSRISTLADAVVEKPGEELARAMLAWLENGAPERPGQQPHSNGKEQGDEPCSPKQKKKIEQMMRSHVITETERKQIDAKMKNGTLRAGECIKWLEREISAREAVEKAEREEAAKGAA